MSLGLSLKVFVLVAGKNIFLNKSPNSTVKNKKQNTTITPAYHYNLYLDNGYSETRLFHRAQVNDTNSTLEQVWNIKENLIYSFLF